MNHLDIAEVARRSGLPASALRFYEEKGLIASVGRRGMRRLFDAGVLDRLALIALWRAAGFKLDEIVEMFTPDGQPAIDRARLTEKADELDRTIQRLTAMRDGLRHAAACPAPSHMECPTFRRIVGLAAEGRLDAPPRKRSIPRTSKSPAAAGQEFRPYTDLDREAPPSVPNSAAGVSIRSA